jgi:hypothetical protein
MFSYGLNILVGDLRSESSFRRDLLVKHLFKNTYKQDTFFHMSDHDRDIVPTVGTHDQDSNIESLQPQQQLQQQPHPQHSLQQHPQQSQQQHQLQHQPPQRPLTELQAIFFLDNIPNVEHHLDYRDLHGTELMRYLESVKERFMRANERQSPIASPHPFLVEGIEYLRSDDQEDDMLYKRLRKKFTPVLTNGIIGSTFNVLTFEDAEVTPHSKHGMVANLETGRLLEYADNYGSPDEKKEARTLAKMILLTRVRVCVIARRYGWTVANKWLEKREGGL